MHAQGQAKPARSPADLAAFLEVLAANNLNIELAGGSDVELGGEFVFAFEHDPGDNGPYDLAVEKLEAEGYTVNIVDSDVDDHLRTYEIINEPGRLLEAVQDATDHNGQIRAIKTVSVGTPTVDGLIRIHIYSVDV